MTPAFKTGDYRLHRSGLEARGMICPDVVGYIEPQFRTNFALAQDAQPTLVTQSNAGIPAYLANYLDPQIVEVVFAPMKAAEIYGEEKRGDWVTRSMQFPVVEHTGAVSSYGDYNENGSANTNANWPARQSYHYQTMVKWGERELEQMALARISWANEIKTAAVLKLNKWQNKTYFYGVAGLQNYGGLNDPSLSAALVPGTKAAGGTSWSVGTAGEIYTDIQSMVKELVAQSDGVITPESKMVLACHPTSSVYLLNINPPYDSVNVYDLVKKGFPNIRFETAVEYLSGTVYSAQLIAEEVNGVKTTFAAFTEKLRAHTIVKDTSSFKQKMSQGTWGTIIRRPFALAQMAGI